MDSKLEAIAAMKSLPDPSTQTKNPKAAGSGGVLSTLIAASGHDGKHSPADTGNAADDGGDDNDDTPGRNDGDDPVDGDGDGAPTVSTTKPKTASSSVDLSARVGRLLWKEEIAVYGSAMSFVRMNTFHEARNRHECEALALSLDEMVRSQIDMSNLSFEIQIRRLLGVRLADEFKDWSFAEALAWKSGHGVQNRGLLRSLLKDRKNFADLKKPPSANTAQSFKGYGNAGRGRKSNRRGGRNGSATFNKSSGGNGRSGSSYAANSKPSSAGSGAANN